MSGSSGSSGPWLSKKSTPQNHPILLAWFYPALVPQSSQPNSYTHSCTCRTERAMQGQEEMSRVTFLELISQDTLVKLT